MDGQKERRSRIQDIWPRAPGIHDNRLWFGRGTHGKTADGSGARVLHDELLHPWWTRYLSPSPILPRRRLLCLLGSLAQHDVFGRAEVAGLIGRPAKISAGGGEAVVDPLAEPARFLRASVHVRVRSAEKICLTTRAHTSALPSGPRPTATQTRHGARTGWRLGFGDWRGVQGRFGPRRESLERWAGWGLSPERRSLACFLFFYFSFKLGFLLNLERNIKSKFKLQIQKCTNKINIPACNCKNIFTYLFTYYYFSFLFFSHFKFLIFKLKLVSQF
jgi:hypothetical protein